MPATLTALRKEHGELLSRVEQLKVAAELVDSAPLEELTRELQESVDFLSDALIPHARAEEVVLYRAYDQVANSPWATDMLRRDHAAIVALSQQLADQSSELSTEALASNQKQELRRVLYGLYALLKQHFSYEEDLLLPRIEAAVTQEGADQLMQSMETAAVSQRNAQR
jgi:hemerythrin-like domain-containing protein